MYKITGSESTLTFAPYGQPISPEDDSGVRFTDTSFGFSSALSSDGSYLAIGAYG